MSTLLRAAAMYFAAVFAAGFAFGVLRTLWLQPALGALAAVAVELPFMLVISWAVCRRVLRRWPMAPGDAAAMGAAAFALLMAAEAALSVGLGGLSLAAHLALFAQPPQLLGLAGQLVFATLPWWQAARAQPSGGR